MKFKSKKFQVRSAHSLNHKKIGRLYPCHSI